MRPFERIPVERFRKKLLPLTFGVFLLCFPLIGMLASSELYQSYESLPNTLVPPKLVKGRSSLGASFVHLGHVQEHWFSQPALCQGGAAQSDFNRLQCVGVRNRAWASLAPVLAPFIGCFVFLMFLTDRLRDFYKRARKRLTTGEGGKSLGRGKVTQPPLREGDLLSRWFLLKSVSVQVAGKRQVIVLIPDSEPTPLPGQEFIVHENGKWLGSMRYVGLLHAPHMVVLSGGVT